MFMDKFITKYNIREGYLTYIFNRILDDKCIYIDAAKFGRSPTAINKIIWLVVKGDPSQSNKLKKLMDKGYEIKKTGNQYIIAISIEKFIQEYIDRMEFKDWEWKLKDSTLEISINNF